MTRYKGRNKTKLVERDFPHHVDMMVPEFGFGTHLDAMYDCITLAAFWHCMVVAGAMRMAATGFGGAS